MFIEKLLQLMAEKKASDIFISAGSPICIKITGTIMPVNPQIMDGETCKKIIYEMLTEHQAEIYTREQELNFSKPMPGLGNFRVNCFWQKGTCGLVIRYITADIPKMADLSLPPVLASLIMEKRGLILVVGATGSGKSTTLASMIDYRNGAAPGHILTMEDPVEYVFQPKKCIINQREVGNDTKSFHDALRNAMRQAPDIILIGEIRDLETMRMALTYALSGHLCLATLHANNAYQAMNRVISFFPLEVRPMLLQDLSVSLKAVMSQRLIKTLDGKRTPAVEVLLNSRNIQELIEKGEITEIKEAMEKSMSPGSQTFEQDLFRLVRQQKISQEEALANADSATNLGLLLGNSGIMPVMSQKTKEGQPAPSSGGSSFGEFKIEAEEKLGVKSLEENLTQYAAYHRDRRNIATHFVGVPMIVFAILLAAELVAIPLGDDLTLTLAGILWLASSIYYLKLDLGLGFAMAAALLLMYAGASEMAEQMSTESVLAWALVIFAVGWAIQFIGHKFEGMKPAFFDDAMQLIIGPLFVGAEVAFLAGGKPGLRRYIEDRVGPTVARRDGRPLPLA